MKKILISYKDSESNITKREISDWELLNDYNIFAFCHFRNEKRTFKVSNIITIADCITGEAIEDIVSFFGIQEQNKDIINLKQRISNLLPSIEAIKCFHLSIRPNKNTKKYYKPILHFIGENSNLREIYSDDEILSFITYKVNVNLCDIDDLINKVPKELLESTKRTIFEVAKGRSRVLINDEIIKRIEGF
ncbi:hypothetical protein AAHK07_09185 [Aliarcobacter cryaerophilus]|uniref:hypothetical protein n=1 Tax=Aliarcobacter cryaerophilus TaxID=28198 RepID=UPI00316CF82D